MYELHAVIGPVRALRDLATGTRPILISALRQDLAMVLVTDDPPGPPSASRCGICDSCAMTTAR